ncbi:uncharacterized protein KY384_000552 [Bacidia gigantensis]|uniref:uncharacterized protein n=1 Tax=Bacidia gigantensis TaxID=2732470 RepID=UPI001D050B43|nr:uncharacterized protein KY384_000552 [Bacidia gigantensis]KAG8525792.1 hypothetical protein KY384_000552 [Bacidia gigantensis]
MTEFVGSLPRQRTDPEDMNGLSSEHDPFSLETPPQQTGQHRFSAFDTQLFALNHPDSSPAQAKKALEAHLAETDRRIQETSKLGSTLVQQRVNLSNRLREVGSREDDRKISPELRQKLIEIERDYNDVGRQSAKAFLGPKADGQGAEGAATPFARDGKRPPSPAKFSNQAVESPSKMNVPRKQRNQASNADNLEFAAEITTSLLGQVRHLQAVLAERDENLKNVNVENARLGTEAEGFIQRLKHLDDGEQRYKDENWNLETQLQELQAQQKDAANREQKLQQILTSMTSERTAYEKELEDLRQSHGKAFDDHTALRRRHESELATLRKDVKLGESEKNTMQRRVDELTSQNEQLAKGIASHFKDEDSEPETDAGSQIPDYSLDLSEREHSPPPSPSKGQRHSMLESETLKSSLHHAHRMIQNLKNNVHREKSEKQDLKRMLQEARDELEIKRKDHPEKRLKTKSQTDLRKAGRPGLGAPRSSTMDIMTDEPQDPEWEDHDGLTPQKITVNRTEPSDAYQTANETEDAFETANERDSTDNDAFQTGAESNARDSSETETETEAATMRSSTRRGIEATRSLSNKPGDRRSIQSTASTSEEEEHGMHTPIQGQPQRFRLKMNRRSHVVSGGSGSSAPSSTKNSPANFVSAGDEGGQSLFAELENISGDEAEATPSKDGTRTPRSVRSTRSVSREIGGKRSSGSLRRANGSRSSTPGLRPSTVIYSGGTPPIPKIPTVDSSTMTEPIDEPQESTLLGALSGANSERKGPDSRASDAVKSQPGSRVVSDSTTASTPQRPVWDHPLTALSGIFPGFKDSANTTPMSTKSDTSQIHQEPEKASAGLQSRRESQSYPAPSLASLTQSEQHPPTSPSMALSSIQTLETAPIQPRQKSIGVEPVEAVQPSDTPTRRAAESATGGIFGSVFGWNRRSRAASISKIVDDDTSQHPREAIEPSTPDHKAPLQEVSANAVSRRASGQYAGSKEPVQTNRSIYDQGSQTVLSSEQIDKLFEKQNTLVDAPAPPTPAAMKPLSEIGATPPANRGYQDDTTPKAKAPEVKVPDGASFRDAVGRTVRRPTSATSSRSRITQYPPLPSDHQEAIAAAAQKAPESMGPPIAPASAYARSLRSRASSRPQTPSLQGLPSPSSKGGTTPRAPRYSSTRSQVSRRTSVSSFASELDERFNIRVGDMNMPQGMSPNTDPRMIQAITQTMIGEMMWKYTRKAGRGEMSNTRHRRFFWVHPYTRTLYWSDRDPASANRAELKSKSVAIEAVRVVTDNNPSPPGLHRKSLIVVTPGRSVQFTAQTGNRHETWFNALSYLLLRTGADGNVGNAYGDFSEAEAEEFNPPYNRNRSRVSLASFRSHRTADRNARHSLATRPGSSYPSQNQRESRQLEQPLDPVEDRLQMSSQSIRQRISRSLSRSRGSKVAEATNTDPPKLAESTNATPHASISSRLSGYWRQPPSIRNSMRSRSSMRAEDANNGAEAGILEGGRSVVAPNGVARDSAEDVRMVIEERERDGALENVRACCDEPKEQLGY